MDITQIREQNGQSFRRAGHQEACVGSCVWINAYDPNVGRSWLEGPYFVTDVVHRGHMDEHVIVFSTHMNYSTKARYSDIWIPIIDTIPVPRGHNA